MQSRRLHSVSRTWASRHGLRTGSWVPPSRVRKSRTFKSRGSLRLSPQGKECCQGACPTLGGGGWLLPTAGTWEA